MQAFELRRSREEAEVEERREAQQQELEELRELQKLAAAADKMASENGHEHELVFVVEVGASWCSRRRVVGIDAALF